jgi:hypothetical protein
MVLVFVVVDAGSAVGRPARVRACLRAAIGENGRWIWFGFAAGLGTDTSAYLQPESML